MALSGLHVTCCKVAGLPERSRPLPILGKPQWSESPSSGSTSTNAAPDLREASVVFEVYSTSDAYISIGGVPNAAASPRLFIPANTLVDIIVDPGDKFAWVAA